MELQHVVHQYDFNLAYAKQLVADVHEEQMAIQPSLALVNHAAFTLGHLVTGSAMLVEDLGGVREIPPGWGDLFSRLGPGDPRLPISEGAAYPSKNELLTELERQHERVKTILLTMSESQLSEPCRWRFSQYMPTTRDLVVFMCVSHEAMHLGQLAAWRRALDLPSALAQL